MARRIRPVDGLLADLRGEGERSVGEFTLDPRQAAEKLRAFQLPDPHHYVLLLAEAAFLGGATFLQAQVSARDVVLSHDAEPGDLEDLFARIFTTRLRPDLKALGLGLNAALRLAPQSLTAQCGEQRLQVSEAGTRLEPCEPAPVPWRLALRHRLGWQLFKKVLGPSVRRVPEAEALTEFCRWAPVPVEVNGRTLPGLRPAEEALVQARLRSPNPLARLPWQPSPECAVNLELSSPGEWEAVLVGRLGNSQESAIDLIVNGIWAGRRPIPNGHLLLTGVVAYAGLERNLSRTDVVDSPELQRLVRQLKTLARDLLRDSLRQLPEVPVGPLRPELLRLLREQVRARDYDGRWHDDPRGALIDLSLFTTSSGRPATCRQLLDQYRERGTLLTTDSWAGKQALPDVLVVRLDPDKDPVLRRIFPRFEDAGPLFQQQTELNAERASFLARPPGPTALEESVQARLLFPRGELGLADPGQPWRLQLGREGRLLGEWSGPRVQLPAGVVGLAYHDGLTPGPGWLSAASCPARAAVLTEVQAALPALYERLLGSALDPQLMAEHLTNLLDYLARSGKSWPLALPEAVLNYPWLPQVNGPPVALAALDPPIRYVLEPPAGRRPRGTLLLTPSLLRVLRTLMGKRAWKEATEPEAAPPAPRPAFGSEPAVITELTLQGIPAVHLRLLAEGRGLAVILREQGEPDEVRQLDLPIPRVEAVTEPADWIWLEKQLRTRLHRLVLELARRVAGRRSLLKGRTAQMEPYLLELLPWALTQPDPDRPKLMELAILPGSGGQRRTLDELEMWLVDRGFVRCAESDPGPTEDLVLIAPPEAAWVLGLTDGRALWSEAGPVPAPAPQEEPPAALPPAPRREEPRDPSARRLLARLRELLAQLEPGPSCRELGERLQVGKGVGLVHWEGGDVLVNLDHPWVRPLVLAPEAPVERLALVLSASFSVLNRALPQVADDEERRFHRSLLERLA